MATKVQFITGTSRQALEEKINDFLAEAANDARLDVALLTVFPGVDDYVAVVQVTAPHLRRFEGEDANEPA